jgi:hypothetical protein
MFRPAQYNEAVMDEAENNTKNDNDEDIGSSGAQ